MSANLSEQTNNMMTSQQEVIILPARLDSSEASPLRDLLLKKRKETPGKEIILDASEVSYIGGLCLQIILSSHYPIKGISPNLEKSLKNFGFDTSLKPLNQE